MRALPLAGGLTWLVLVGLACAEPVDPVRRAPHLRLTSLFHAGAPPLHGVGADFRPVLEAFPATRLLDQSVQLDDSRRLDLELELPARLAREERLVIEVHASPPTVGAPSRPVGAVLVRPEADPSLRVALPLGEDFPEARELLLRVDARRPPGVRTTLETPEVEIPAGATLELATGLMSDARGQGAARFTVLACRGDGDDDCRELLDTKHAARGGTPTWRDHRAALGGLAGERVRLRFETSQPGGDGFAFPLWGNPTVLVPDEASPPAPNLILISLDTLRADHLPTYGYPRDTAPFLDGLARSGTVFEHAITAASSTTPAHMSLFTSLPPSAHGVVKISDFSALAPGARTLAEMLGAQGFVTAAFCEDGAITRGRGFERGFDFYYENPPPVPHVPEVQSARTFARALDWLDGTGERRLFLFLHTYEVHAPYEPPAAWEGHFEGDGHSGEEPGRLKRDLYDREIRYLDGRLEALWSGLAERGLLERSLVVVTSDHGEEFYEHGFWGHGATVYEEQLRVPLLFVGPGVPSGQRIAAPVGFTDILPTLLELMGVPVPAQATGTSFAPLLRGEPAPPGWSDRPFYSEAWYPERLGNRKRVLMQPTIAVRQGQRKLLRRTTRKGFQYEYYDLARDPHEQIDLHPRKAPRAADLHALLEQYDTQNAAIANELTPSKTAPTLDPDQKTRLRALGYTE